MTKSKQPIEIKWALLCKSASVDRQSNQVSIFNVIEDMALNKTPDVGGAEKNKTPSAFESKTVVNAELTLVVQLERDEQLSNNLKSQLEIIILDPSGEELGKTQVPVQFEQEKKRLRVILGFNNLIVKSSGTYDYLVRLQGETKGGKGTELRVPVDVKIYQ